MPCEELDIVWNNIKAEARALADCEPMLASFYHATLLKHENLGSALSYMLANKLASSIMPAIAIREVVEEARKSFAEKVFATVIPRNVRLSEAPSFGEPILYYDAASSGAEAYRELGKEVAHKWLEKP